MPKSWQFADKKFVEKRHRGKRGTTLTELLVAAVFAGGAAGSIIGATGFASKRAQDADVRALATSIAQDQMECARAAAKNGTLVSGTRTVRFPVSGSPTTVTGQTLAIDHIPANVQKYTDGDMTVVRNVTLEPGTTDVYKIIVTTTWQQNGTLAVGRTKTRIETFVRVPSD